ncbi:MAG TPA: hypothetical protein VJS45_07370, partial [Acidimicrobiia bacterium]|nr:hypothetical protein [Acidimicrobiia bacterium]
EDLLVTVIRIDLERGVAVIDVFRRPLILWVWIGGLLVAAGGTLALRGSDSRRLPPRPASSSEPPAELVRR